MLPTVTGDVGESPPAGDVTAVEPPGEAVAPVSGARFEVDPMSKVGFVDEDEVEEDESGANDVEEKDAVWPEVVEEDSERAVWPEVTVVEEEDSVWPEVVEEDDAV
jgi:hypothetical protein